MLYIKCDVFAVDRIVNESIYLQVLVAKLKEDPDVSLSKIT